MRIEQISNLSSGSQPQSERIGVPQSGEVPSFGQIINKYLDETNQMQLKAGEAVRQMASGQIEDIHEVMIAVEKSRVSLELVIEIRNRLLEAYRELMRMQV
ncbi:MAG: flagellar hook-basal body complex protein FliE [candidate division KSB1 bacterium]|nr:flagellar hook-basal body complex protein FliE [candidate division KSB1 bacterium]